MTRDWKKLYTREADDEGGDALVYTDTAMDHFIHPRNVGKVDDCDGYGKVGDPSCGDYLELMLKLDMKGVITEIGFLVQGCAGAISTSSMVTELAKGMSVKKALTLTDDDVVHALGGLPESKKHCSLLGVQALRVALYDAMMCRQMVNEKKVQDKTEYRRLRDEGKIRFEFPNSEGNE